MSVNGNDIYVHLTITAAGKVEGEEVIECHEPQVYEDGTVGLILEQPDGSTIGLRFSLADLVAFALTAAREAS